MVFGRTLGPNTGSGYKVVVLLGITLLPLMRGDAADTFDSPFYYLHKWAGRLPVFGNRRRSRVTVQYTQDIIDS